MMTKGAARQQSYTNKTYKWERQGGLHEVANELNAAELQKVGRKQDYDFHGPVHEHVYGKTVAFFNQDSVELFRTARAAALLGCFIASHAGCPALRCVCVLRSSLRFHLACLYS